MYELFIGNKNYSSWSMRPWVLMRQLGIAFTEQLRPFHLHVHKGEGDFRKFSPSGKVPLLVYGDLRIWDSLAITEFLAERHPGVWPAPADARAFMVGSVRWAQVQSGGELMIGVRAFPGAAGMGRKVRRGALLMSSN